MVLDLVVLSGQVDTALERGGLEDGRRRRAEVEADAALGAALPAPDRPARLVGVEGQVEDTELGEGGGEVDLLAARLERRGVGGHHLDDGVSVVIAALTQHTDLAL